MRLIPSVNVSFYSPRDSCPSADLEFPVFRGKFSAIHKEYTPQPSNRTFYVHLTTVTDPKATRVLLATGQLAACVAPSKSDRESPQSAMSSSVTISNLPICADGNMDQRHPSRNTRPLSSVKPPLCRHTLPLRYSHLVYFVIFDTVVLSVVFCVRSPSLISQLTPLHHHFLSQFSIWSSASPAPSRQSIEFCAPYLRFFLWPPTAFVLHVPACSTPV
jgi:hypothetical protein